MSAQFPKPVTLKRLREIAGTRGQKITAVIVDLPRPTLTESCVLRLVTPHDVYSTAFADRRVLAGTLVRWRNLEYLPLYVTHRGSLLVGGSIGPDNSSLCMGFDDVIRKVLPYCLDLRRRPNASEHGLCIFCEQYCVVGVGLDVFTRLPADVDVTGHPCRFLYCSQCETDEIWRCGCTDSPVPMIGGVCVHCSQPRWEAKPYRHFCHRCGQAGVFSDRYRRVQEVVALNQTPHSCKGYLPPVEKSRQHLASATAIHRDL